MDVADMNVAATVDKPANSNTGNGREEPEPEPRSGSFPNTFIEFMMTREYWVGVTKIHRIG